MTIRSALLTLGLLFAAGPLVGCAVYESSPQRPVTRPVPPPPVATRPPVGVDIDFFYDALDPDGDWLWIQPHGWVWVPNAVDPFWRPYTVGRWVWTDWGWTWVSAERWGWATYHYGRWVRVKRHGWAWIPGDVWGPAWVAWRHGSGIVGWAPLPPEARFRVGVGLDWGGIDIDVAIRLDTWCFLDEFRFVDGDLHRHAYPVGRNATVIRSTRDVTRVRVVDRRIVNEGIDRREFERKTKRPVPARRIVDQSSAGRRSPELLGEEIRVFRPEVRPGPPKAEPRRGRKPVEPEAARQPLPAPPARPAPPPKVEDDAERRWDRRWNQDWRKLERVRKRDEPVKAAPAPPRPDVTKKQSEENYEAAENAHRELLAERERAKRRAERGPKKAKPPAAEKEN